MSNQSIRSWWASLTPDKRKTVMGVGGLVLLLGVLYLFVSAGPDAPERKRSEAQADVNLLTGSDARTLGLDAVGAELKEAQRKQRALEAQVATMQKDASTRKELQQVSEEIAAVRQSLATLKEEGIKATNTAGDTTVRARDPREAVNNSTGSSEGMPRGLFESSASPPGASVPGRPARGAVETSEPIKVRAFGEVEVQTGQSGISDTDDVYIPAGSMLSGVLLTGVDAPTGLQSKRDPIPALMRIKHDAILPNRFRSDIKECFVVLGATGDLSTERAFLRGETLSCVRVDGGVIEVTIDAYANGDDGKAGVRGRLVSRNGALVAKAAFASFAEALSQIFRPVMVQGLNTTPGQRTQFQAPDTSDALEAAGYAGFGGAMRSLSDYFVDLADEIVPFIEVDAARPIEVVLLKGVLLKIRSTQT